MGFANLEWDFYVKHCSQGGTQGSVVEYGRRVMREWFGEAKNPHHVIPAHEMGWGAFDAHFSGPNGENLVVGYVLCTKPLWLCSRMGVNPSSSGNSLDISTQKGDGLYASGPLDNYPIHPSVCFYHRVEGPDNNWNISLDPKGYLLGIKSYGNLNYKDNVTSTAYLFFDPSQSVDQAIPERKFDGPTDDQLEELSDLLLGGRGDFKGCEMAKLLVKPESLTETLLAEFGNSPSYYIAEETKDRLAYSIRGLIKDKPWAWINGGEASPYHKG